MGSAPSKKKQKNTTQQQTAYKQNTTTNTLQQTSKISADPQDRRISEDLQQKPTTPRTSPPGATPTREILRPLPNNDMSRKPPKAPTPRTYIQR